MKEYYLLTRKNNELEFFGLYEVEDTIIRDLTLNEKTVDYEIIHYLSSFTRRDETTILNGENVLTALFKRNKLLLEFQNLKPISKTIKLKNAPGNFYSRIYRPILSEKPYSYYKHNIEKTIQNISGKFDTSIPHNEEIMISSINQLAILTDELNSIFKTLHPTKNNYKSYGHNLRNLLILACTEVEAQLKGIIKSNSNSLKINYRTNDYYKLKEILKLDHYKVALNYYPSIELCIPFKDWRVDKPTQSLKWYDSYNAVKHDREDSFHRANLINTINAISSVAILIVAQYGLGTSYWNERIGNYYNFQETPKWKIIDYYIPPFETNNWQSNKIFV